MQYPPYTKGLIVSQLSEEELEQYRSMPPPKKYGDIATTAPQDKKRGTVLSSTKGYLSSRETRERR